MILQPSASQWQCWLLNKICFIFISVFIFSLVRPELALTILIMSTTTTTTTTTKMSFSRLDQQEFGKFGLNLARVEIV